MHSRDDFLGESLPFMLLVHILDHVVQVLGKRAKMIPCRHVLVRVMHIPAIEEDDLVVGKVSETIKVRTQRL